MNTFLPQYARAVAHGVCVSARQWKRALASVFVVAIVSQAAYAAKARVLLPRMGAVIWSKVTDPTNPSQPLKSIVVGGSLLGIKAAGKGDRTATFTIQGLAEGYYRVEFLYPQMAKNARTLKIKYKRTGETTWKPFGSYVYNQATGGTVLGPIVGTGTATYQPVSKDITAMNQEFWIKQTRTSAGQLIIQVNDLNCTTGLMLADSIRVTFVTAVKDPLKTSPWQL